jgi:hypothetical protein
LSPYTNSDDLREGWQQTLTRELGHRDSGLVMADLSEYKGPYAQMTAACEKVGMAIARKPAENRSNIEEQVQQHSLDMFAQANMLDKFSHVSYRDVNLNAKVLLRHYASGTGSFNSIENCVSEYVYSRCLLHCFNPSFRDDAMWPFIVIDRRTKLQLNKFTYVVRKEQALTQASASSGSSVGVASTDPAPRAGGGSGQAVSAGGPGILSALAAKDGSATKLPSKHLRRLDSKVSARVSTQGTTRQKAYYAQEFGTILSNQHVNSNAYFKRARLDLMSIIHPGNRRAPSGMLTVVANFHALEIRATVRRGPFAAASETELTEHLLKSNTLKPSLPAWEKHPAVATMAYQRRRAWFLDRAMRAGSYDTIQCDLEHSLRRTEEQQTKNLLVC